MNINEQKTVDSVKATGAALAVGAVNTDEKNKAQNLLIGLCFALALLFASFELTSIDVKVVEEDEPIYDQNYEEDMIPVTIQEEQQPAAPVVQNVETPAKLDIQEDDVELEKEVDIKPTDEPTTFSNGPAVTGAPPAAAGASGPTGPVVEAAPVDEHIYDVVEVNAQFPGGDAACYEWLNKNIKYPAVCQENNIQGRVNVKFVVNLDGSITDVEVVRSPDDNLSKEAVRVVKLMPKWKPARQGNKNVRSRFILPVNFRLQ
ncbi:MAG: energy transducer TonB [Bacteroidales bacterium]|nr:energy transducer TonB [Bacteroidales bacterium]